MGVKLRDQVAETANGHLPNSVGLDQGQYRHNMGFHRVNGVLHTTPGLPSDVAHPGFQGPRLFFLGDENLRWGAVASEWADLWREFYDVVRVGSGGVAKVALGSEPNSNFFDQMLAELPSDRQWFDEWLFQRYGLSDSTVGQWMDAVKQNIEWSLNQTHVAPIVLLFSQAEKLYLSVETLDQAMAFIQDQEQIVEAIWWKFEQDGTVLESASLSTAGAVSTGYGLTNFGKDFRRLSFKYAIPSSV